MAFLLKLLLLCLTTSVDLKSWLAWEGIPTYKTNNIIYKHLQIVFLGYFGPLEFSYAINCKSSLLKSVLLIFLMFKKREKKKKIKQGRKKYFTIKRKTVL